MKKVLFSPSADLIRVIKLLQGQVEIASIHAAFSKQLKDMDIQCFDLAESLDAEAREKAACLAASALVKLCNRLEQMGQDSLPPALADSILPRLPGFFYHRLGELSLLVAALDKAKPDCLVLHNDVEPVLMAAALWAREHSVPCLHVPHAIYMPHDDRGPLGSDVHDMITASHLAAAGPFQARWYAELGMPPQNIRLTGLPKFERWVKPADRLASRNALRLRQDWPVVVYASSWAQATAIGGIHNRVEEAYLNFLQAASSFPPEVQVVVKVHPSGNNLEWHVKEARQRGIRALVTAGYLEAVLAAADMIISFGPSNIVLDAAFHPWVRLAVTHGFETDPEVIKVGLAPDQMADAVRRALAVLPPPSEPFLDRYLVPPGGASERIAAWILELAGVP